MKDKNKILLGLGIAILLLYLYNKGKKASAVAEPKYDNPNTNPLELTPEDYEAIKEVTKDSEPKIGDIIQTKRGMFKAFMKPTAGQNSKGFTLDWGKYFPTGALQ